MLFRGLVEEARSPDEVAGILGRELGHVEHRDTMKALLRQFGLTLVLGGLNGNTGGNANALISMSFSRDAEHEADLTALAQLKAANIAPRPTAEFFRHLVSGGEKGKQARAADAGKSTASLDRSAGWLASHPSPGSRYYLFELHQIRDHRYDQSLSEEQWRALRSICADDKSVKPAFD